MKIVSWNVNGIRSVLNKGFNKFVDLENPDILCIQEIKAHPEQAGKILGNYPYHYWNSAVKKGYSGTAIFSKIKPLNYHNGIGIGKHDNEGRVITLEFKDFYIVNVYTPNSGRGVTRLKYRVEWDNDFLHYLKELDKKKPVIACGDFNVAHTDIDLSNPKPNYNKTAGYMQVEIDGMTNFIKNNFIDSFREFHKEGGLYSYWSYMFNARKKNIGWRIDYFLVSKRFIENVKGSLILKDIMGSDHAPIELIIG